MPGCQYDKLDSVKPELKLVHLLPGPRLDDHCISIFHVLFSIATPPKDEAYHTLGAVRKTPNSFCKTTRLKKQRACTALMKRRPHRDGKWNDHFARIDIPICKGWRGRTLEVTLTLAVVLQHLRQEEYIRMLWIGTICTHQQIFRCNAWVTYIAMRDRSLFDLALRPRIAILRWKHSFHFPNKWKILLPEQDSVQYVRPRLPGIQPRYER